MKCEICGKNAESNRCFRHKSHKNLSNTSPYKDNDKMNEFFLSIWKKRPHKSEISGDKIYGEALSIYFHHILPKNKYPDAMFDEENIIILTFDEHSNVENDMYKYEEINKRREQLKIKLLLN